MPPPTCRKSIPPKQLPLQQKSPAFCQQPEKKHDKGRSLLMEVHTSPGKPSISCLVPTIIARAVAVPQAIAVVVLLKQTIGCLILFVAEAFPCTAPATGYPLFVADFSTYKPQNSQAKFAFCRTKSRTCLEILIQRRIPEDVLIAVAGQHSPGVALHFQKLFVVSGSKS